MKKNKLKKENIATDKVYYYLLATIIILTIIVFSGTFSNDFVINWDDDDYVLENVFIRNFSPEGIKIIFTEAFYSGNYHPLTTLVNTLEYHFFALDPKPYHIVNLFIHIFNTILVFRLIFLLTSKNQIALITAALFALHPMHVESVAWISELKDLLYTLFFLVSIIYYVAYINENKRSKNLLFSIFFFLLSLLSKSAAVSLPMILLLIDYFKSRKWNLNLIYEKIPFFLLALIFGLLAIKSQTDQGSINDLHVFNSVFDRIAFVCYGFVFYFYKLVVPAGLSALYPYPVKISGWLPVEYYLAPLGLLAIIFGILKSGKNKKEVLFGIFFFTLALLPMLQILPVGNAIVADRYSYVAYIGLFFIVGFIFSDKLTLLSTMNRKYAISAAGLVICLLSFQTFNRVKVWKNGMTLFSDAIEKGYYCDLAYGNRGIGRFYLQDYNGAIADYDKAIEYNPKYSLAYYNRGVVRSMNNEHQMAFQDYTKALEFNRNYANAFVNRGVTRQKLGDFVGSIADHTQAIRIKPDFADAYNNRGNSKYFLNDKSGACEDWYHASQLGFSDARENFRNNCK